MAIKPDLFVCRPDLMINEARSGTFLRFEIWDTGKGEPSGKSHILAMSAEDSMMLLKLLETIQREYNLPKTAFEPVHISVPSPKGRS